MFSEPNCQSMSSAAASATLSWVLGTLTLKLGGTYSSPSLTHSTWKSTHQNTWETKVFSILLAVVLWKRLIFTRSLRREKQHPRWSYSLSKKKSDSQSLMWDFNFIHTRKPTLQPAIYLKTFLTSRANRQLTFEHLKQLKA